MFYRPDLGIYDSVVCYNWVTFSFLVQAWCEVF